jgi:hypothetical protein
MVLALPVLDANDGVPLGRGVLPPLIAMKTLVRPEPMATVRSAHDPKLFSAVTKESEERYLEHFENNESDTNVDREDFAAGQAV